MAEHVPTGITFIHVFWLFIAAIASSLLNMIFSALKRLLEGNPRLETIEELFSKKEAEFFIRAFLFIIPLFLIGYFINFPELLYTAIIVVLSYATFDIEMSNGEPIRWRILENYKEFENAIKAILEREIEKINEYEKEHLVDFIKTLLRLLKENYITVYTEFNSIISLKKIENSMLLVQHKEDFKFFYKKESLEKFNKILSHNLNKIQNDNVYKIISKIKEKIEKYLSNNNEIPYIIIYLSYEKGLSLLPHLIPYLISPFCTLTYSKKLDQKLKEISDKAEISFYNIRGKSKASIEHEKIEIIYNENEIIAAILPYKIKFTNGGGTIHNIELRVDLTYIQYVEMGEIIQYLTPFPARDIKITVEVDSVVKDKINFWFEPALPYTYDTDLSKEIGIFNKKLRNNGSAILHLINKWVYPGNGYTLVTWEKEKQEKQGEQDTNNMGKIKE